MGRRKKEIVWPHLNNEGESWYVEYSVRNPKSDRLERFRHYEGFKELPTFEEKMKHANALITSYSDKIKSGDISFTEFVEYEDMLAYNGSASFLRHKKTKAGSLTLYLSDFLEYKKSEIDSKSYQTYVSKMRIFGAFLEQKGFKDKPVSAYSNGLIVEFLKLIASERNLSRKSIEKYQQILHSLFKYIIDVKKASIENPVLNIPRIGKIVDESPAAIPDYIRNELFKVIVKNDPQLWMAICFQYYSAIRPGTELRLMKLNQINYAARTITIKNFLAKNSRTEVVDIPYQLFNLITHDWNLQQYDQNFYVFGRKGVPGCEHLGKNTLRNRFNIYRDQLNLPKEVKFYSWKHSGAQELSIAGINIYELQRHLRHKSISTTEQYLKKRLGQRSNNIRNNFPNI